MVKLPEKWQQSQKSLRAVQLAFEFNQKVTEPIRQCANDNGLSPSDQIRKIIGLSTKKPKRPRLTVSLSAADYQILALRYQLNIEDKAGIRAAIAAEISTYAQQYQDKS